jgi:glycosyltransferase involved in cell wall biosynthesis
VVQAAAFGKPILTRDSEAIRRFFRPGENIALVEPGSADSLAQGIRDLLNRKAALESMGEGARKAFAAHFSTAALSEILKHELLS